MKFLTMLIAGVTMLACGQAGAAGFQRAMISDPEDRPLAVGIWYPSDAPVSAEPNTPFRQALAIDGVINGSRLPLVVVSHGYGGWLGSHADTALALAEAGFVVVAVTHTGNNYEDESYPMSRWTLDRPRHVRHVLDYMLHHWRGHDRIDASRIGIFGFSAGGYTALVSIGGVPDPEKVASHCRAEPDEVACRLGAGNPLDSSGAKALQGAHDPRIKAAAIAAPGLGFGFDAPALARVTVPVQLWAMSEDRVVPHASNSEIVRRSLPKAPDFRMVEGAGHYAFLQPCDPLLEKAEPKVWAMICTDPPGFDRGDFHQRFNREVAAFFKKSLANE